METSFWIAVGVFGILAVITTCVLSRIGYSLSMISDELRYMRASAETSSRVLGQIGNFLWPQHVAWKRWLEAQDDRDRTIKELREGFQKEFKAAQQHVNRPATRVEVQALAERVEELAAAIDDLDDTDKDLDKGLPTADDVRGILRKDADGGAVPAPTPEPEPTRPHVARAYRDYGDSSA